jgi:hypothetical protein
MRGEVAALAKGNTPKSQPDASFGAAVGEYPVSRAKGCQLTCDNTTGGVAVTCGLSKPRVLTISNTDDTKVAIGDATDPPTATTGYFLLPGKDLSIKIDPNAITPLVVRCIRTGGASKTLSILEGN